MSPARALAALAAAVLVIAAAGCRTPHYRMTDPPSFKRFPGEDGLRMITADGVMLKVREVENYPLADLAFWVDAMRRHLEQQGYALQGEPRLFDTKAGRKGARLVFVVPRGQEDWVLGETVFVVGERIVLVETAGPYELHAPLEKEIDEALATFDPGEA